MTSTRRLSRKTRIIMKTQVIQVLLRNGMPVRELTEQISHNRFSKECSNDAELLEAELVSYRREQRELEIMRKYQLN